MKKEIWKHYGHKHRLFFVSCDRIRNFFDPKRTKTKIFSVMPFAFNAVELYVVTINEKPGTRAREVCRVLEFGKATKAADIVKHLCSRENYAHKW